MSGPRDTNHLLSASRGGDAQATEELLALLYPELRALAASFMRRERSSHTLQPTALVHEAYLRLVRQDDAEWHGRAHFFSVAAEVIRRVLVDHARRHGAAKRGGNLERVLLSGVEPASEDGLDLLALDDAMEQLRALNERQGRIVELRYFGGLTIEETATALEVSSATVKAEWAMARAWLQGKLES